MSKNWYQEESSTSRVETETISSIPASIPLVITSNLIFFQLSLILYYFSNSYPKW